MLKLKEKKSRPKKVLIYGHDGTGKSTFAEDYCQKNNLKAVCLDVDDTNFTSIPSVEFERSNHIKVKNPNGKNAEITNFLVNGEDVSEKRILLKDDGKIYNIEINM